MGIANTIQLKQDACTGNGKFAVRQRNESSNDSHVAVVQSDAIELMILDKRGNVLQDDVLDLDELTVDKSADIQVIWCDDEPTLVIAHTNHLLRVVFDCSTKTWKADINKMLDQRGWISSLALTEECIYTGSSEGIWEVGIKDLEPRGKLCNFPTTVVSATAEFVAAGDEQGGICLFEGGSASWSQTHRAQGEKTSCCTSMLIFQEYAENALLAAFNTGFLRLYSLSTMECLSEVAAHIRWITQILPIKGGFCSTGEDSFIHLWTIGKSDDPTWDIRYLASNELTDCMITAAAPYTDVGILVTAYDRSQILMLTISGYQGEDDDDEEAQITS